MKSARNHSKLSIKAFITTFLVTICITCDRKDKNPSFEDTEIVIDVLVEQLGSESEIEVLEAIEALSGLGDSALPYLIPHFPHKKYPSIPDLYLAQLFIFYELPNFLSN